MLRGEVVVGQLAMLAVERHYKDLQAAHRRGFFFSPEMAWHCIDFVQDKFVHIKGPLSGKPILLDGWQQFWTAVFFGWRKADGRRRFRTGYEEVARKNGKSTWWSPIGAYLWWMDGEPGAEVYTIATTRDQAMAVFRPAFDNVRRMMRRSPRLRKAMKIAEGKNQEKMTLFGQYGDSVYEPLAANAENLDGKNPSCVLVDELHAHPDRTVWDVMESALGAREEPVINAITTAGFILDGICVEIRAYLVKILRGEIVDDSFFGVIYTIDEGDDPFSETVWPKANPSLGSAKTYDYMRAQAAKAKALPSARANFMTKDLNVFVGDALSWFDMTVWDKGGKKFDWEMLKGRRCFGGLDLASTRDLSAYSLLFPPLEGDEDGDWYLLVWCWVPEAKLQGDQDAGSSYAEWARRGHLFVTDGDITDYRPIYDHMLWTQEVFDIVECGFDRHNANWLEGALIEADFPLVKIPQNIVGLSPGAKLVERLVYGKRLKHGGHPVLRWCAGNTALMVDSNENIKPDKKRSQGRIDPIVSTTIAATRAVVYLDESSIYEKTGLRTL